MVNKTEFYNGNPNIKKVGVTQKWTPELIDEYEKCKNDVIYFAERYCKIVSLDHGLVLFKPRDYQKRLLKSFSENRFTIALTSRQVGKTITAATFLLHYAIFNSQKFVAILANKAATAREILSRVQRMLEHLPFFLQPGVKEYNKSSIKFGNGSEILAAATSSDSIRGFTFNCVMLDEFAFVDGADEFYTSTYPVISSGKDTKIIITSTPNGMNLYYKIWKDAMDGKNEFNPIRVDWWEIPHYDEEWKKATLKNIGEKKFNQEYGNTFYGSSGTLISGDVLERLTWDTPILDNGKVRIWEEPEEGHNYVITVDPAEGVGGDYSVVSVIDITEIPYKEVARYRDNMTPYLLLPEIVYGTAIKYNYAFVAIETNSIGSTVATMLYYDYEYENILTTVMKRGKAVMTGGFGSRVEYGLRMTAPVKNTGCSSIKTLIEDNMFLIRDDITVREFYTFAAKAKSYEAEEGYNDDVVMSLVLFGWLVGQSFFKELFNTDMRKKLIEFREKQIQEDLVPPGFYYNPAEEAELAAEIQETYSNETYSDFY